jgi:hypothetical protein
MHQRIARQTSQRRGGCLRSLFLVFLIGIAALNGLAFVQARAMTTFVPGGQPLASLIDAPLSDQFLALVTGVQVPRPQNQQTPSDHYLPYETRQIALGNGEMLEGWLVPHPQPLGIVVMFPGYAGSKDGLLTPAAHLYQFGYSSLLVDFRGVGGSSRADTTIGMREAEDVASAAIYAQHNLPDQPLILYGVSMGSTAILRAVALEGVKPAAIIAEGVFDRLLTTSRHRFDAMGLPASPAAELLIFWGSVQMGYNGLEHNPVSYAARVESPVLLLHGEHDPWITSAEIATVHDQLRGPKRFVQIPGVGHAMPFVYVALELWVQTVRDFLAEHG